MRCHGGPFNPASASPASRPGIGAPPPVRASRRGSGRARNGDKAPTWAVPVAADGGGGSGEVVAQFGIAGIDGPLGGGLRRGIVADVYGPPASGKTQLAYRACAGAAAAGRRVLFIDTKGEFRPERVLEMAGGLQGAGAAPASLLDLISVSRVASTAEQELAVGRMAGFDLAVVDGLTDLFTFEFDLRERRGSSAGRGRGGPGRRRAPPRHLQFAEYARALSAAASQAGAAVVATNSIRSLADGSGRQVESLGAAVSLFAHARVRLDPGEGPDSGWTLGSLATLGAQSRFAFRITDAGLEERSAPGPAPAASPSDAFSDTWSLKERGASSFEPGQAAGAAGAPESGEASLRAAQGAA